MKRVLIVRLDAIGDYILWRNCLRFLRRSEKYRDAHLTVLGNPAWRNLAETFDSDCADEWIWAQNRADLFRKGRENVLPYCIWHRRVVKAQKKLKARLVSRGFDEVISPCAFPDALLDELVLGIAPVTISVVNGDASREARFTRLVDPGCESFVFLRNRAIMSAIAGESCAVDLDFNIGERPKKTNQVLFFKGASHWTRRWPQRRWKKLAGLLSAGLEAVDAPRNSSLADLARFVASCAAVVSNDTMALHMAAALGVPAVGVVNGVSGRDSFWPYPAELGCKVAICAPERVSRIPIPLLGSRLAQYLALSSVKAEEAVSKLELTCFGQGGIKLGIADGRFKFKPDFDKKFDDMDAEVGELFG